MIRLQRVFWGHLLAATAALAIGLTLDGAILPAIVIVFAGGFWFSAQARGMDSTAGLLLYLYSFIAVFGILLEAPGWLMLAGVVAALAVWDLDHFLLRLRVAQHVELESGLGRAHLRRLALVEGAGFLAGLLALSIQSRIPFWWEVLLALVAVIALSLVVRLVRRQPED